MQFPVEINFGNISLPLHAIVETAAFFIGFRYFLYLKKKQGDTIASAKRIWILIAAIFGALIGSFTSGYIIQKYFTLEDGSKDWFHIWITFASYALVLAIIFPFVFKDKFGPKISGEIKH